MEQTGIDGGRGEGARFIKKKSPADSVGIALHHHGAVFEVRQQPGGNVEIILQEIALGESQVGPEDFLQVGQLDRAAFDGQFGFVDVYGDDDGSSLRGDLFLVWLPTTRRVCGHFYRSI